ncbi:MAG: citrate synthase [Candidatus Omnitrophica bacterium]|nr:citrate synthase [Candidatus Omnitrophota bacterium]
MSQPIPTPSEAKEAPKVAKGLEGVIAAQTSLSHVDGPGSQLYYRGIPVREFIESESSSFEEVVYLLWNGRLPKQNELDSFRAELGKHRPLRPELIQHIRNLPKTSHPMAMLRTLSSVMGIYDPDGDGYHPETSWPKAFALTAQFASVIAAFFRIRQGLEPIPADPDLAHAEDFLRMMHGRTPEREMVRALDAYLILLADHGLNASTFAARVTTGTQSDIYSAVTSAVGTLKGDLHGSANQRAMEMILDIGDPARAETYVGGLLDQKKKVMGFGHRIYKLADPRAEAFREIARKLCERAGNTRWMEISNRVEKVMLEKKQIPCNVDFFSASVLYVLGFPIDFFTTIFAASRIAGWTAHVIEQQKDNRLIRPSADYTGPMNQHYTPIGKR